MTIDELTQSILSSKLTNSQDDLQNLREEIFSRNNLYLIASPNTSKEDWARHRFAAFVNEQKGLVCFLTPDEASTFATRQGCILDGKALVRSVSQKELAKLVAEYEDSKLIDKILIYTRVPIHLVFTPQDFSKVPLQTSCDVMKEVMAAKELVGVDKVRKALDTFEPNARKKLDPGARYENIHTLVESLIQQNNIDPDDMDTALNLPSGYTRNFCINLKDGNPSRDVILKYLSYFGLQQYLYLYRKDCLEVLRYLKDHRTIDRYTLKYPAGLTAERFKLESIVRGHDGEGLYVYRLHLVSKEQSIDAVVSNPLNLLIGREYQLMDADGKERSSDANRRPSAAQCHTLPNQDEMDRLTHELDAKASKKQKSEGTVEKTYEEVRKDEIIGYFRKRGLDGRASESKYKALEMEPDILEEFYRYTKNKQFGKLELQGYTAKFLIKKLHLEPFEAYQTMVQLRSDPQKTKQWLKYRERDPQYQKPANRGEEGKD